MPARGARFSISTERLKPQLPDSSLKLENARLQRADGARVQAQLEMFFVDPVVEGGDVAGGHDGE